MEYEEFENVNVSSCVMEDVFNDMDRDGDGDLWQVNDDDIKAMVRLGCGDDDKEGVTFQDIGHLIN